MAFRDWLRKQQERSERNRQLFEGRPMVRAEQAWGGYQDRLGGQTLRVRQPSPPASVTLTEKNDGTRTKVTKWEPEKSQVKVSGIADEGVTPRWTAIPPPRNQRNPFRMPLASLPRGRLSPEAQSAIAQVQATGGQNVDAYGNRLGPDLQSYRAMQNVTTRPNLQTIQPQTPSPIDAIRTRQNISRFAPVVGTSPYGRDIRGGAARIPSGQEEGLFRDPVSSGLPTGSAPRSSSHPSIMSMGMDEFYSWLRRQKQGIADRQERNRINRLMQNPGLFRSRTPYYPTGGRY